MRRSTKGKAGDTTRASTWGYWPARESSTVRVVHTTIPAAGVLTYIGRMAGDDRSFRFLSNDEFLALSDRDKATYLLRASQELENRQRQIRAEMQKLPDQIQPKK